MTKLNTSMTKLNNQAIKGKIMTNTTVKAREIELKTISWRRAVCFSGTSREQTTVSPPMCDIKADIRLGFASRIWYERDYICQIRTNPRRQADEGFCLVVFGGDYTINCNLSFLSMYKCYFI